MNSIIVNGKLSNVPSEALEKKLLFLLRDDLGLTGVKNGCAVGVCGACTVLLNDKAVKSCIVPVKKALGGKVTTIEGLQAPNGELHPLQQAFLDAGAVQCGFCTPGMILTAYALLLGNKSPTREEIREALKGNLCRCTGYQQIVDAVQRAAPHFQPVE